ncbi:protein of unknown function, partial (plasmid) [Azospirillum baldaniorum]
MCVVTLSSPLHSAILDWIASPRYFLCYFALSICFLFTNLPHPAFFTNLFLFDQYIGNTLIRPSLLLSILLLCFFLYFHIYHILLLFYTTIFYINTFLPLLPF